MINLAQTARLKSKFRARTPVFGAWTSLYHPSIVEIFAGAGVDFVGIDIEHSTIDLEQSSRIISACQAHNVPCLPRVASHNTETIKRLLDAGADGIIVPMVNSAAEVDQLAGCFKYPPEGQRSFGVARAHRYGLAFDEYIRNWNQAGCLIIQIESLAGVSEAATMLKHDAVDAVMVGPYDLSGSLEVAGQLDHPQVRVACERVLQASASAGKGCGTHLIEPDLDGVRRALAAGYTLVVMASDVFVLERWAARMRTLLDVVPRTPERMVPA